MTDLSLPSNDFFASYGLWEVFKKLNREFLQKGTVKKEKKCLFFFMCKCKMEVKYGPGKKKKKNKRKISHICIAESFKGHLTWKYF